MICCYIIHCYNFDISLTLLAVDWSFEASCVCVVTLLVVLVVFDDRGCEMVIV